MAGETKTAMTALTAQRMAELIEARSQARRQGNYPEADRIRSLLEQDGWLVVDEQDRTTLRLAKPWMQNQP